jgi:MFS family permease
MSDDFSLSGSNTDYALNQNSYLSYRRWVIFGVCTALFIMSMFYRVSGAIIAPNLSEDLNLNPQELGLVGGVFFYSFAVVQIPLGLLLDRIGTKVTMIALNIIGIIGVFIFSQSSGLNDAVFGRALLGLGMAGNLMGTLKIIINWFDQNRFATLSGLIISLGTIGSLAATSPLAMLVEALGWRNSFIVLALLHLVFVIALALIVKETPSDLDATCPKGLSNVADNHALSLIHSLKTLFLDKNYWAISFSIFLRYGSFASIQALWAGPFLLNLLGLPTITAGNVLLMLSVGFILGAPIGGFFSDRILRSRKKAIIIAMSGSAVAILIWAHWESSYPAMLLGALLFINGFFNAFNQISFAHIRELMPPEMSGTAMTGINVFSMAGAGVFVHGLGGVISHMQAGAGASDETYRLSFLICFTAVSLSVLLYFLTSERLKQQKKARPGSNIERPRSTE